MTIKSAWWRILNIWYFKVLNGVVLGRNSDMKYRIYLKISRSARVRIGDNFTLYSGGGLNPLSRNVNASICVEENAELLIGDDVGMSSPVIWAKELICIGNKATIGANVVIFDSDCHSLNYKDRGTCEDMKNVKHNPIKIGDNVLIGTGCYILKGVTIGDRSIIGAGSVVTQDIPSDCIAAGNPCRVIKSLI